MYQLTRFEFFRAKTQDPFQVLACLLFQQFVSIYGKRWIYQSFRRSNTSIMKKHTVNLKNALYKLCKNPASTFYHMLEFSWTSHACTRIHVHSAKNSNYQTIFRKKLAVPTWHNTYVYREIEGAELSWYTLSTYLAERKWKDMKEKAKSTDAVGKHWL